MSAYVVSEAHINALVTSWVDNRISVAIMGREFYSNSEKDMTEIGRVLLAANICSVLHRYPNDKPEMYADPSQYTFKRSRRPMTAVQTIKACKCYEYQACETPEWFGSMAERIVDVIKDSVVYNLPGYEQAEWEIMA